ncbi:ATP-binding cassette domain-containing protein [Melaminivora sp.]
MTPPNESAAPPVIELRDVHKRFVSQPGLLEKAIGALVGQPARTRTVHAVNGISLQIQRGEVLGLVGESGCGKSTLGRIVAGLHAASAGQLLYQGRDVARLDKPALQAYTLGVQMVFQDPQASLNPRQRLRQTLGEPLQVHGLAGSAREVAERVDAALAEVGLSPEYRDRLPHQLSGGQRQRIGIARALMVQPQFLVCDEPVAALDVSIQAQVINLLMDLRAQRHLTCLFISHDLGVVRHISDRVGIMYLGKLVELASTDEVFRRAQHPYTQALLAEMPDVARRKRQFIPIQGEIPSPLNPPSGCSFHPRCPRAIERCRQEVPPLRATAPGHWSACHGVNAMDSDVASDLDSPQP